MADKAESALSTRLQDIPMKQSVTDVLPKQMILTAEDLVLNQIYRRIELGQKTIPSERKDLAPLITKLQSKHAADIERMIRLHRLHEAQRIKDQLEQKLTHLQDRIEVLNELETSPRPQKQNLQNKEVRHQFMSQEEDKRRENSELVKKLAEEQKERMKKQRVEAREMMKQKQEELEKEAERQRKLKEENILHIKEQEKVKFEQLAMRRKEYMQSLAKLPRKKSPTMHRNASMPELERKKQEIAAKRKLESWVDVKKHMQEYDEEKKKKEDRHALDNLMGSTSANQPKFAKSKFLENVKEEEQRRRELEEQAKEEFAQRMEMKKRYGEIIKEMYAPVVDPDLQQELEQRTAKLHTKPRVVQSQANSTRVAASTINDRMSPVSENRPKKQKPKHTKSQPPEHENPKKPIDYLREQVRGREATDAALLEKLSRSPKHSLDPQPGDVDTMISKIAEVEQSTLRKERLLKRLDVTNPQVLSARESLDSELLASVKTKLALIKSP